jgi:hypothetical protein
VQHEAEGLSVIKRTAFLYEDTCGKQRAIQTKYGNTLGYKSPDSFPPLKNITAFG